MELVNRFSIFQNYPSFSDVIAKRTKQASENGFSRQNSRFLKWDNTADFENETKPSILQWDKTADFVKERKLPSKLFLW